ncbi:3-methyladenine DNA glycosylase/8-oxoguanine DNA glycosylase [Neomicrococcus aestuarii]|uniref:3-methyladenine DNA glycosylase/8-oxoguanine DNA glycosylase n=1 Tax=Neomicrococcus aestuarii TaxID=556325 RepID=A0A7W8TWN3_9MICC|nr:3-methyladenine DNA glycosylase [Neomicrococcus aestuarii]MBB5513418.1 3-methyladenine DNA glycosylase/8-oxoguanine DNA glycosylase [Neomicrococcus aestuarii]
MSFSAPLITHWDPCGPFDLARTLGVLQRGANDPTVRVSTGEAWLCFQYDGAATAVRVRHLSAGAPVEFAVWSSAAEAVADSLPRLVGAHDDWAAFDDPAFVDTLPRLVTEARRRHPGIRFPATGRVFDALVPAILEQKVTGMEARYAWAYLVNRFGTAAPGPVPRGMKIAPTAAGWRRVPTWEWHKARVDYKRRDAILRCAHLGSGLDRLSDNPDAHEVEEKMRTVPGVGAWTAAEVLQRTHGSPDHISVGDFHLAHFVGQALTGRRTDDAGMLELLEPWTGHRQRVVRMLGLSGAKNPSYGPRLHPMDHRAR